MYTELTVLVFYALWVILVILLQVLLALPQVGLGYLASPRDEGRQLLGVAGRCERALGNSVTALALFAPAILVIDLTAANTPGTLTAAWVFLFARIFYVPVYLMGIPWLRTAIWLTGLAATAYLYYAAL